MSDPEPMEGMERTLRSITERLSTIVIKLRGVVDTGAKMETM